MNKIFNKLLVVLIATSTISNAQTIFEEKGGALTIPAESLILGGSWQMQKTVPGFNGTGYIVWTGADSFATQGASGLITTKIKINTPGTYLFKWRNKVGEGTSSTDFNDSWLKFSDATDFYGKNSGGGKIYPKGSGKTPNPEGVSSNGFFKIYCSGTIKWTDKTLTSDFDGHSIYVQFATAGVYTMLISARSKQHLIDEIYLNLQGALSVNENTVDTKNTLSLYPNPIEKDGLLSVTTTVEKQKIVIADINGKVVLTKETSGNPTTQIQLIGLQSGSYIIKVGNETSKLIVK